MNSLLFTLLLVSPVACRELPQQEPQAWVVQNGVVSSSSSSNGYVQLTVEDEDKGRLLLIKHGDRVTALLDDDVLSGDRVQRDGDKISVLDPSGKALYEIRVLDDSNSLIYPYDSAYVASTGGRIWTSPDAFNVFGTPEKRKLIGVTTSSVDGALRAQLGLEGDAFVIDSVTEDRPADRAGMQPFDVVVAIDGDEGANTEKLREALDAREAGDTLNLTVLREGKRRELTLTLEEPRSTERFWSGSGADTTWPGGVSGWAEQDRDAALKAFMERDAALDAERAKLADKLAQLETQRADLETLHSAESARRLAELAAEQTRLTSRQAEIEADLARRSAEAALLDSDGSRWLMLPSGQGTSIGIPPRESGVSEDRYKQLEERLARLEELLERLVAREQPASQSGEEPGDKP